MNNIAIARETIQITKQRRYRCCGQEIVFPDADFTAAEVITPEQGAALLQTELAVFRRETPCRITVTTEDSYAAARRLTTALVLNFANAHHAGGGFLLGANAQEEALCRCSTLYASITSEQAAEMYRYNNTHPSAVESDYMLLSPDVLVFRTPDCTLSAEPFCAAVITAPAPNRRGAAVFASAETLRETFLRRIRIILRLAAVHGYRNLVLGAWGCGAFGNDPKRVAAYFHEALREQEIACCFDEVCFAVYGTEKGKNYRAFYEEFT